MAVELQINGRGATVDVDATAPLLYVLRNDLGLNGPRFGCGLGQCGSCTVLLDGQAVRSCVLPVSAAIGRSIRTLDGLAGAEGPHPVQAAFIAEQAGQCGYCTNGMIMSAVALLEANPAPSEVEIRNALDPYLCRCGTHTRILKAVRRAAGAQGA
jgi:nicotinate dehydrogenase subunit A